MEVVNVDALSDEALEEAKTQSEIIIKKIIEDLLNVKKQFDESAGQVKIKNVKVDSRIKGLLKFAGKIALNFFLVRDHGINPAILDNRLPNSLEERKKYYIKCSVEELASMCYQDLEKGLSTLLELLKSDEEVKIKAAIDIIDNIYCGMINYNYSMPKYDLLLLAVLAANDTRMNILEQECFERCQILHNYHKSNLGLGYDFKKDMEKMHNAMELSISNKINKS